MQLNKNDSEPECRQTRLSEVRMNQMRALVDMRISEPESENKPP